MNPVVIRYKLALEARKIADEVLQEASVRLESAQELADRLEKVEQFFAVLADERRAFLERRVEGLVDYGLKTIFGQDYAFRVKSELAGKQIKTRFFVVRDGLELGVMDSAGGGIADVVSFLLRVVVLTLKKPSQQKLLILDEPFKHVSDGYIAKATELLVELEQELGVQIILVTHRAEITNAATTLVRVAKAYGKSVCSVAQ